MKRLILIFSLISYAWSATVTTITQQMVNPNESSTYPNGLQSSGWAEILLSGPCVSGANIVSPNKIVVPFNGVFSVKLVPTDTCTAFGSTTPPTYSVTFHFDGNPHPVKQTWCVYSSSTPLNIAAVTACSPQGSTLSWSTITPSQWAGITAAQWAAIIP